MLFWAPGAMVTYISLCYLFRNSIQKEPGGILSSRNMGYSIALIVYSDMDQIRATCFHSNDGTCVNTVCWFG